MLLQNPCHVIGEADISINVDVYTDVFPLSISQIPLCGEELRGWWWNASVCYDYIFNYSWWHQCLHSLHSLRKWCKKKKRKWCNRWEIGYMCLLNSSKGLGLYFILISFIIPQRCVLCSFLPSILKMFMRKFLKTLSEIVTQMFHI